MPRTPGSGKGGEHRSGAVVLTPARGSEGSASSNSGLTPNSKSRGVERQDSETGRGGSWGRDDNKGQAKGQTTKSEVSVKGQAKGKAKGASKVSEAPPAAEAKASATQPRVRDEIQDEVDAIVSKNSNLLKPDFDGRVFQYLHAIHGVGGQEKVRKALETIHLSTLQKQRAAVKKWPAYLATLLKKFFDNLGAEKKEERDLAKVNADTYSKELSISVDALFEKPAETGKEETGSRVPQDPNNPAANPQEAGAREWLQQVVTEEREQQWLRRGNDALLSALTEPTSPGMPESPIAIRNIPPGFTPPQVPSPSHANSPAHGNMFGQQLSVAMSPAPGFASTPSPLMNSPPSFSPPPPPAPQLPLRPPPPPPTLSNVPDVFKQQPTAPPPPPPLPPHGHLPVSAEQQQGPPRVISPPAAPTTKPQQQTHQPRVVPPPQRRQQSPPYNAPNTAGAVRPPPGPPPPPNAPPTDASGVQLLPETSWTVKSARPPPWPAQYVSAA